MRIPLSWLAEFVTWSGPAAALAERLTMAGLKIEAIEEVGQLDRRIVAGPPPPPPPPPAGRPAPGGPGGGGRPPPPPGPSGAPRAPPGAEQPAARARRRALAPSAPWSARVGHRRGARGADPGGGRRPLPALLRARRARRRHRAFAALGAAPPPARRHAGAQRGGRRDQLRDARARPAAARLRPGAAHRAAHRGTPRRLWGAAHDPRRRRAHARAG